MKKAMAIAVGLALVSTAALGGGNPANKMAIHVKAHPTTCGASYPGFSQLHGHRVRVVRASGTWT